MPYKLNVNGRSTTVDVPAEMPMLWVIRDVLNLRGTKFGCGGGFCGACTIHMNGRAVRSCQTPVAMAANQQITTLEWAVGEWNTCCPACMAGTRCAAMRLLPGRTNDDGVSAACADSQPDR